MADLILSEKYKAFLRCRAPVEFLEGTTAAGKTTVGLFKFILRVVESPKKLHVLSGLDQGTIEKNIITKDLGVLDDFGDLVEYWPSGRGEDRMAHLVLHTSSGDKKIYVLGYADKARWKKALGGQYGCLYIDEINIADMDFVREASMRCDYLLATLNPDDPSLPIYEEYINHSRPLPEWEKDTPREIQKEMNQEPKQGWVHWFFSFDHNAGLSPEKIQQIISMVPPGTKLYKNKILGLRGRASGLVFNLTAANLVKTTQLRALLADAAKPLHWIQFSCGVDTSYSQQTEDTFAFVYTGILTDRRKVTLAAEIHSNKERARRGLAALAPSDIPPMLIDFLERACGAGPQRYSADAHRLFGASEGRVGVRTGGIHRQCRPGDDLGMRQIQAPARQHIRFCAGVEGDAGHRPHQPGERLAGPWRSSDRGGGLWPAARRCRSSTASTWRAAGWPMAII